MGALDRYLQNPYGNAQTTDGQVQPQIDSSNAIVSLAAMMGPTPAEREAAERRMQKNQAQMAAWTGLFDGLRQLGNLYYTAKGAVPQKYDNPYSQVQQNYQQQRQLYNDMATYRRNYATSLYNLRRQMADDARRNKLADAQADYYNSREETARQKAELDKLKAVRVIKMQDGSLMKFDPASGTAEPLTEADPLYEEYMRSRINKNNRTNTGGGRSTNNGTYGYVKKRWMDANGVWHEERTPTTGERPGPQSPSTPPTPQQPKQESQRKETQTRKDTPAKQGKKKHVGW